MKEQKPIEEEEEEDLEFSAEREALKFWSAISSSSTPWKKTRSCRRLSGRQRLCDLADVSGFASGLAAAAQDCGDDGSKEKRGRRKR